MIEDNDIFSLTDHLFFFFSEYLFLHCVPFTIQQSARHGSGVTYSCSSFHKSLLFNFNWSEVCELQGRFSLLILNEAMCRVFSREEVPPSPRENEICPPGATYSPISPSVYFLFPFVQPSSCPSSHLAALHPRTLLARS